MDGIHCSQFIFYNDFDSANMSKVELVLQNELALSKPTSNNKLTTGEVVDVEFNVWTKPDCDGTEFENGNRTWFYFGIKAPQAGLVVRLNMVNLNRQGKMYSQGMAPIFRILPGKPKWERIQDKPVYMMIDDIFTLSFKFRSPENLDSCTYFAFTYPFSYVELQRMLVNIDTKYLTIQPVSEDDIYYVHETVCCSLEGRNVDLITISSYHGITMEREDRLKGLFPDTNVPRPHKFAGKKVVFVSARVHPGETPSSFVFNGFLNLLLNRDDLQAQYLRKLYVFKLIPFLNPDGVARGHYRTDTRGVNLNRVYLNPSITEHPSIYAARALIRYYHYGVEKEDKIPKCDSCVRGGIPELDSRTNENDNINKMSTMSLAEDIEDQRSAPWCSKCKASILKFEKTMPGISTLIPTFSHGLHNSIGHNFCRNCGCKLIHTESKEEVKYEAVTVGNHGDVNGNQSGLFLYMDLHGHASKKGIFMYGNHFEDLERRVECMLLPKLMGLNNHHFHFQGCNFTERNMYLRDKRDGMSRAGSGRVAVLSLTGVIKSYTLECNYNTGRLVNVLPPTIRETTGKVHTLPVPPKYTPQIFEEVGKSLGASILDLTGQNPFSRLPNSEFHNLTGLRDWLRNSCCTNDFGGARPKLTHVKGPPNAQGKCHAMPFKNRMQITKPAKKTFKARKDTHTHAQQPCCSKSSSVKLARASKVKNLKAGCAEKQSKTGLVRGKRPINAQKAKTDSKSLDKEQEVRLKEICFIKSTEGGKTMIAKYRNKEGEEFDDSLIVSWDAPTSKATIYTHKSRIPQRFVHNKAPSEPGTSKQGVFRVHNFAKSSSSRTKIKKQALRRLSSATELGKSQDKKKKRKPRVK